jgi:AcrR family transcriptional regulator
VRPLTRPRRGGVCEGRRFPPARGRIIDSAIAVVVSHGYEATTTEMVLERAGVSRACFEANFADKDELCRCCFEDICERFNQRLIPYYLRPEPWRQRLRAAAYEAARYGRDHELHVRFSLAERLRSGDLTAGKQALRLHLEAVDSVRFELAEPEAVTSALAEFAVGSFLGLILTRLRHGGLDDLERYVPELMYRVVASYAGVDAAEEELLLPPPEATPG